MRKLIIYIFTICLSVLSFGQNLDEFYSLTSKGDLPEHLTTLSVKKYYEQAAQIDKSEGRFETKSKKDFYQKTNYWVDQLMLSGKITFGDPVSEYLNDIADVLLKDYPDIRKEIKIYTAKSHIANASSTDQGIIMVNAGLVARVQSEAVLAYILAHEIIHYMEDHSINQHLEKQRILYSKGKFNQSDINDEILNVNSMSRDHEFESDELAYTKLYKKTNYCLDELEAVFELLLLSEAPFAEIPFDKSFFENEYYQFPKDYYKDSIPEFNIKEYEDQEAEEDEEDDEWRDATHPSTRKRKLAVLRLKIRDSNEGREKYIVSETKFNEVKNLCRFESIKQFMISKQYIDAIYNSFVLLQEFPNNKFLETTIASSLYLISHYKTNSNYGNYSNDYLSQSNEIEQIDELIENLNNTETNVLAIKYLVEVRKKHGGSIFIDAMLEDLCEDLCIVNKARYREFFTSEELKQDLSLNDPKKEDNDLYYLNALAFLIDDPYFSEEFKKWDKERKIIKEEEDRLEKMSYKDKKKIKKEEYSEIRKTRRKEKNYGKALDVNKFVVVDPIYIKVSQKHGGQIDLKESELKKIRYKDRIEYCINKGDFDTKVIDSKSFKTSDINDFNNLALLNDWLIERMVHDIEFDYVPYSSYYIGNVVDYYKTNHYMWTGVFSERVKKPVASALGAALILTYGIALPPVLVWACIPDFRTYYFSFLFNVETGERELIELGEFKGTDVSGDFVNSSVYDSFSQISKQDK